MTGHWHKIYNTFSKFSYDQHDVLKSSVPGICTLKKGDYAEAAAGLKTAGCDSPLVSGSHCPDASRGLPLSTAPDTKIACATAPLAKVAGDVSVLAEGDLEATEPNSDVFSLELSEAAPAPLRSIGSPRWPLRLSETNLKFVCTRKAFPGVSELTKKPAVSG